MDAGERRVGRQGRGTKMLLYDINYVLCYYGFNINFFAKTFRRYFSSSYFSIAPRSSILVLCPTTTTHSLHCCCSSARDRRQPVLPATPPPAAARRLRFASCSCSWSCSRGRSSWIVQNCRQQNTERSRARSYN